MLDNRDMEFVRNTYDKLFDNARDEAWNRFVKRVNKCEMELCDDGYNHCPACGKLYNNAHFAEHPNYCEDCGQAFDYADSGNEAD